MRLPSGLVLRNDRTRYRAQIEQVRGRVGLGRIRSCRRVALARSVDPRQHRTLQHAAMEC